jgi:hypothetical protein
MFHSVEIAAPADLSSIHSDLVSRAIPGYLGLARENGQLLVCFDGEAPPENSVLATLSVLVESAVTAAPSPAWDEVRRRRIPLIDEADVQINKAEDQGRDTKALRTYRQALRDVTKGAEPANPVWPTRPW